MTGSDLVPAGGGRVATAEALHLDPGLLEWCGRECPGIDPVQELERAKDYWAAKGVRWKDYRAAFRNWMRKAKEIRHGRSGQNGERRLSARETQLVGTIGRSGRGGS